MRRPALLGMVVAGSIVYSYTVWAGQADTLPPGYVQESGETLAEDGQRVTGIRFGLTELSLQENESGQLTVYAEPSGLTLDGVRWSSDDPSIAYVYENGVIAARSNGTTTIWGVYGGYQTECQVTVHSSSGWQQQGNSWYYLEYGNKATGSRNINGVNYYFKADGSMAAEEWVNDAYYDADGKRIEGMTPPEWQRDDRGWRLLKSDGTYAQLSWENYNNQWYYLDAEGYMLTGWQRIDGSDYYLYQENDANGGPAGARAVNQEIDGRKLDESGRAEMQSYSAQAAAILDQVGWNAQAAYNWCAGMRYERMTATPDMGSRWYADYGFRNHRGNCYVMAASCYELFRTLGMDVRMMTGTVPLRRGGMGPHSWVEVIEDGVTYVCDPDFQVETGRNGYRIRYGQSGTWRYTGYSVME